jgi:hypothetical protein
VVNPAEMKGASRIRCAGLAKISLLRTGVRSMAAIHYNCSTERIQIIDFTPTMKFLLFALLALAAFSAVTVREIKNVTTKQLVYAGTAPPSASSASNLFFLFYGVQGVTDRTQLASYPTLVVLGKYILVVMQPRKLQPIPQLCRHGSTHPVAKYDTGSQQ